MPLPDWLSPLARLQAIWFAIVITMLPAFALEVSGPARVIDGDTLEVGNVTIRLQGIDAAETGQRCLGANRKILRPGDLAATYLQSIVKAGVACTGQERDAYGRLIATCRTATGDDIERLMVSEGLAWAFVRYSTDYVAEEAEARRARRGVWAMACEPPWEFRAGRWKSATQKAPAGCPIKGNISGNGRIYQTPWSRDYAKTRIDTRKGERWFCSEKEALAAGWRPPVPTGR